MNRTLLLALLVSAFVLPAAAASPDDPRCGASGIYVHAFSSPADQLQELQRTMLENGATTAQTITLPAAPLVGKRYLVIARYCDAWVIPALRSEDVRRAGSDSIVVPGDHPFEWEEHFTVADATTAYDAHATSAVRAMTSTSRGSLVVIWSKR